MALDEYSVVAMAIQKMDSKLEKLSDDVSDVRVILGKQDVLLEKIINLEANANENNKRIHHRIDEIESSVIDMRDYHLKDGCPFHQKFAAKRDEYVKHIEEKADNFDTRLKVLEGNGKKIWEVARNKAIEWAVVFVILAVLLKFGVTK